MPVWFGGHHDRTLERIAKYGDGWMPNAYTPGPVAAEILSRLRRLTEAAVMRVGHAFEQATEFHRQRPALAAPLAGRG